MAASLEETSVTYEQLTDLEQEFEDVETEIIRQQVALNKPLLEKRAKLVSQIPNFWPLVFEQAPPDVDQYIQPSDSAVLLSSLTSVSVSHFEIENGGKGDPRSVAIKFEFSENEHFEDSVLEKKFWYRRHEDGWAGLVSEPVPIKWKEGKDLTEGLLDKVVKMWELEQQQKEKANGDAKKKPTKFTPEQKALKEQIENTGLGGLSFFSWFGYIGERITAEESRIATEKDLEERRQRAAGKPVKEEEEKEEEEGEEDEDDLDELEIFPDGDELAVAIAEDLWPSAIKYFIQAQEQDALSDFDFEELEEDELMEEAGSDAEDGAEGEGEGEGDRPAKKRKA